MVSASRETCYNDVWLAVIAREHALRTCIVTCHTPTYCIFAHTNTSTPHTHTHTHGLVQLAETLGSYFSHKSYMSMNVHTCVRAHTHTHTHSTHSLTQTHTHTDWACTTCSDIGSTVFTKYTCTCLCTHT